VVLGDLHTRGVQSTGKLDRTKNRGVSVERMVKKKEKCLRVKKGATEWENSTSYPVMLKERVPQ